MQCGHIMDNNNDSLNKCEMSHIRCEGVQSEKCKYVLNDESDYKYKHKSVKKSVIMYMTLVKKNTLYTTKK